MCFYRLLTFLPQVIFFILMEKKQNFKCEPQYFTFPMFNFFTMNHSMKLGTLKRTFLIALLEKLGSLVLSLFKFFISNHKLQLKR